jgi:WD40 repeat protein
LRFESFVFSKKKDGAAQDHFLLKANVAKFPFSVALVGYRKLRTLFFERKMIRACTFDAFGTTLCIGGDAQGLRVVDFPSSSSQFNEPTTHHHQAGGNGSMYASAGYGAAGLLSSTVKPIMVSGGGAGGSFTAADSSHASMILSVKIVARVGNSPLIAFVGSVRTTTPLITTTTVHSSVSASQASESASASAASNNHHVNKPQHQHRVVDSDRCVHVYDVSSNTLLANMFFETAVIALQMNRVRLVVILEKATYIFQLPTLEQLSFLPMEEPINRLGLGTLSQVDPVYENCFYAFPMQAAYHHTGGGGGAASREQSVARHSSKKHLGTDSQKNLSSSRSSNNSSLVGDVMILDAIDLAVISSIQAHRQPIAAMEFAANGTRLATCSTEGTNIKVWSNPSCTLLYQLRRGSMTASVRVLAFNHTADMLVVGGEGGTIHLFCCGGQAAAGGGGGGGGGGSAAAHDPRRPPHEPSTGIRSFAKIYIPVAPQSGGGGRDNSVGAAEGDDGSGAAAGSALSKGSCPSVSSSLARGKCRMLCAFSEDSRVLRVVLERWDYHNTHQTQNQTSSFASSSTPSSSSSGGGGGSILTILAQYKVDRDARKLYEAVLGGR